MNREVKRKLTERQLSRRHQASAIEPPRNNTIPLVVQEKVSAESINRKFSDTGMRIVNNPHEIVITLPKENIRKMNVYDLAMSLQMLTNPLFIERKMASASVNASTYNPIQPKCVGMPHIGVFMNSVRHYSGGRYYAAMLCKFLAMIGCKVTLVTESIPFFISDFKFIDDGGRIGCRADIDETVWLSKCEKNDFDLVLSVPMLAGVHGFNYAKKWKIPVYMMIFETPNYVSKFRGGLDSGEGYWYEYKMCLSQCDKIICLANTPMVEAKEWLREFKLPDNRFEFLYPAINTYIADKIPDCSEKDEITFIGRHVDFKNPIHVIDAIGRVKDKLTSIPVINFIGTHSDATRFRMVDVAEKYKLRIRFFANVNDEEKFAIIKRSKVIVIPSLFEGFGLPPAEAFYCKKPVVAYPIAVTKEIYGNCIDYARVSDAVDLGNQLAHLLNDPGYRKERGQRGYEHIVKICHPFIFLNNVEQIIVGSALSISIGMIVLNGEDTIQYSLRSIYDCAKEILIVEGSVVDYARVNPGMINNNGGSVDNTIRIIQEFPDPQNKIKLLSSNRTYKSKMEMQNIIAENVAGDIYLKVDSDEIYKRSDIERIRAEFRMDPKLTIFKYRFYHFWHSLEQIAVGGQWESKMVRCWKWNKHFRHPLDVDTGFNYYCDKDGKKVDAPSYVIKDTNDRLVYHLNYAMQSDAKIKAKINYYAQRGIELNVKDTWSNWKMGDRTNPTHPDGTTVEKFVGALPIVLQNVKIEKITGKERIDHNVSLMTAPALKLIKPKWTIGMIVLNGEQFIKNNVESLLKWKDLQKIVIVEGADNLYPKNNVTREGLSTDGTARLVRSINDKRIEFVQVGFQSDKQTLRNVYIDRLEGTHLLVVDVDEFYMLNDLKILTDEVMQSHESILQWEFVRDYIKENIYGGIIHFWHTLKHRVAGGYYSIPHQRIYKIVKGMRYTSSHNHPTLPDGIRIDQLRHCWSSTSIKCYHGGFMITSQNMEDKQKYYSNRGEKETRIMYTRTRELWVNWDGQTLEYPYDNVRILPYTGIIPEALKACELRKKQVPNV